jgi:hypothetical protein
MIVISTETNKSQNEIIDFAVKFFSKNMGLKITEQNPCCLIFGEMYQNYVMVTLNQKDSIFEVKVESREYDYFAKRFIEEI